MEEKRLRGRPGVMDWMMKDELKERVKQRDGCRHLTYESTYGGREPEEEEDETLISDIN